MREYHVVEVTLTVDTAGIYASGDVLADTQEITGFFQHGQPALLESISILDVDDLAGAMDILFLKANSSIGTENAAFAPSDAVAANILAYVEVVAGDYEDLTNSQFAHLSTLLSDTGLGQVLYPDDNTSNSIWIAAVSKDTKTYTTAAALQVKVGIERDA